MPRSGSSGGRRSGGSRSRSSSRSSSSRGAPSRSYGTSSRGARPAPRGSAASRPHSTYTSPSSAKTASSVPVSKPQASKPSTTTSNDNRHVVEMRGPGLGQTIVGSAASGLGLGMGLAAGQAAVNGVVGAFSHDKDEPTPQQESTPQYADNGPIPANNMNSQNPCFEKERELWKCINDNPNDIQVCQFYKDAFEQCRLAGNF